ncbi:KIF4B-like protein [Mya arenaria]|uniref:KIF4B-like protein n=1 Tax=Mya arenaria TaxID=6604 RepID=A0ABY7DRU4_MYAAR|nr:KIF4B-like protein [Mya arenaria]
MPESVAIKVYGRCRPFSPEESKKGQKAGVSTSGDKVVLLGGKEQSFSFDGAYPPEYTNIYKERCETLAQRALEGYNVTMLALGGPSSGKSMLMSGTEEDPGIIPQFTRSVFEMASRQSGKDFLINGLSELIVKSVDEVNQYFDQGSRARKMGSTDMRAHRPRAHAVFTLVIEQRERQSSKVGLRSVVHLVDVAGLAPPSSSDPDVQAGLMGIQEVLNALGGPRKGAAIPYRASKLTRYLQESLGGNSITVMFALVSPVDKAHQDNLNTLTLAQYAHAVKNKVKLNLDETNQIISELREEISRLRDKLASTSEPNRDDVLKMEELVKDLQIAKKQTWDEKQRASTRSEEERKLNLANKGILEFVMDSGKKGNKEVQDKIQALQREKDQANAAYKDRRATVDRLKAELQQKIAQYSKMAEKESENKALVTAIHKLKESLKQETDKLKVLKQALLDVQERQNMEKQLEERHRLEESNKGLVKEELDRVRLDVDAERAEIQMHTSNGKTYSAKEGEELEVKVSEMKAEKSVVTLKLQCVEQEKARMARELEEVHRLHKEEMELQQLQHYQTFRNYREMFEEQKAAIEQRYRHLLEDSIQDAIFLSARNNELITENQDLKLQINEMKDVVTKLGGRLPASVENPM